jgi:hypothetical protein
VRRLIPALLVRALVVLLALEVADTPIFCADERPAPETRDASYSGARSGNLHVLSDSIGDDAVTCFCPCHLTFESEAEYRLASASKPTAVSPLAPSDPPPASSRAIDHPPQNLG